VSVQHQLPNVALLLRAGYLRPLDLSDPFGNTIFVIGPAT
jgi:hypothetical protein